MISLWSWRLHSHGLLMALIEINGLPNLKMGGSFHGELLVITRWYLFYLFGVAISRFSDRKTAASHLKHDCAKSRWRRRRIYRRQRGHRRNIRNDNCNDHMDNVATVDILDDNFQIHRKVGNQEIIVYVVSLVYTIRLEKKKPFWGYPTWMMIMHANTC